MKKDIHPQYYKEATVTDTSSGDVWKIGSTVENMTVEISSKTHPFYTGKQKIVDTDDLVKRFEERKQKANTSVVAKKKQKKVARRSSTVSTINTEEKLTLKDMLKQFKS